MLTKRIVGFLNAGDMVVAEVPTAQQSTRCFVRIRPVPSFGVPREERRYLNSRWSMWEYWDFEFRRLVLRDGWKDEEWDYDHYIIEDQRKTTIDSSTFDQTLEAWAPDPASFLHSTESEYPD